MKKLTILILVLALCALNPLVYAQQKQSYDFNARTPVNAALRSLILPGWGQFFNGQKTKGYILGAIALSCAGASIVTYQLALKDWDDYEKKGIPDDPLYDNYKSKVITTNFLIGVSAAAWLYAVLDAYFVANKKPVSQTATSFFFNIDKNHISLNYIQRI